MIFYISNKYVLFFIIQIKPRIILLYHILVPLAPEIRHFSKLRRKINGKPFDFLAKQNAADRNPPRKKPGNSIYKFDVIGRQGGDARQRIHVNARVLQTLVAALEGFLNHDANTADFRADLLGQRDDAERRFAAGQKIINQQNVVVRI